MNNAQPQTSSLNVVRDRFENYRQVMPRSQLKWHDAVWKKIKHFTQFRQGWDGYHAEPVDPQCAAYAMNMLEYICSVDSPEPQIVPGFTGDLQIEWHLLTGSVELHIRAPYDVHASRSTELEGEIVEELQLSQDVTPIVPWIRHLSVQASNAVSAAA